MLKMVAAFLETSYVKLRLNLQKTVIVFFSPKMPMCRYERGSTLAGVLYFHRISDFRMSGIARRNFSMFRKLCGDNALQNVVIVTNMWGEVDPQIGNAREAELAREDIFFKPVIEKGARMARHANTVPSAEAILRLVLDNHPMPLRIQEELVNEHKDISETGAGEELNREIAAQIKRHQEEMRTLREEMEQAMKDKDEETKKELEIETKRMQKEIERFQNDSSRLESDYKQEKERLEARMNQMEEETRKETERRNAEYQRRIDEMQNALDNNNTASERERAQMLEQINEMKRNNQSRRGGFFSGIGNFLDELFF